MGFWACPAVGVQPLDWVLSTIAWKRVSA